jgi:hypothetical protein
MSVKSREALCVEGLIPCCRIRTDALEAMTTIWTNFILDGNFRHSVALPVLSMPDPSLANEAVLRHREGFGVYVPLYFLSLKVNIKVAIQSLQPA